MPRGPVAVVVALVLAGLVVACGSQDPPGETAIPGTPVANLTDGEHTGFVRGYDGEAIELDPAPILTGAEALAAAEADGLDVSEGLPNDFYIPPGSGVERWATSPSLTIELIDNTDTSVVHDVDPATFRAFMAGEVPSWAYASPEALFVTVEVADGVVVGLREFYLP